MLLPLASIEITVDTEQWATSTWPEMGNSKAQGRYDKAIRGKSGFNVRLA